MELIFDTGLPIGNFLGFTLDNSLFPDSFAFNIGLIFRCNLDCHSPILSSCVSCDSGLSVFSTPRASPEGRNERNKKKLKSGSQNVHVIH